MELVLTEATNRAVGSGYLAEGTESVTLNVASGIHVHPSVSLVLVPTGPEAINFMGTFEDGATITGRLNGWRFNDTPFTLHRQ